MQSGRFRALAMGILLGAVPWALGQAGAPPRPSLPPPSLPAPPPSAQGFQMTSSGQAALPAANPVAADDPGGVVVKEIDDAENGNRWLLTGDPSHPGGPGLLRLAGAVTTAATSGAPALDQRPWSRPGEPPEAALRLEPSLPAPTRPDPTLPVIRSGDRIVIEQHTRVVDARLEAVAIGPARAGAAFSARLLMGGGLVRVVAVSAGRALLAEESQPEGMKP